jgi:hypothetical protein
MSFKRFACAFAAVFSMAASAAAATITFQFTGVVTYGAPMAVLPGTPIVGTFSYDTSTAPTVTYKGFAAYEIAAPLAMSASVGGHSISSSGLNVAVWNHYKGNLEDFITIDGTVPVLDGTTFPNGVLGLVLGSAPRNNRALNSTKLPSEFNISLFDAPGGRTGTFQRDGGPDGTLLQFTLDSIVVVATTP